MFHGGGIFRDVRYMSSVRLSSVVCRLSVTFVHPTQAIEIFGYVSTPFGTLAISDLSVKMLNNFKRPTMASSHFALPAMIFFAQVSYR